MKRILITGANSYIGTSFEKYLKRWPERYQVDTVDMVGEGWKNTSFSGYDTVFHVAGIAHSDFGKISPDRAPLYYSVNTQLAVETAEKAKADGVKQFVFMSSASVYGDSAPIGKMRVIYKSTPISPVDCYGDSKAQAEKGLLELQSEAFRIVILRPPMIYGKGSKGNYPTLSILARQMPVFPLVHNSRSMLYIENLVEFVRLMVDNEEQGIFCPQNNEYTNTSEMVKMIAQAHNKHIVLVPGLVWVLKLLSHFTKFVDKAFGNLCYDKSLSAYKQVYCLVDLEESVHRTEEIS